MEDKVEQSPGGGGKAGADTALDLAAAIRDGRVTSLELVEALLAHIERHDGEIGAFAFLDPELARAAAKAADEHRYKGRPLGPLHGVPVAIKDIIDTSDMPTQRGTPLYEGRVTSQDARLVALLREAGAIILGKTVTSELAVLHPGKTRNPHNTAHTPGGSSSGSAAAVAAGMVPLAIGSQTNGSVIRPASFCGVFGFKPSYGGISRRGVMPVSAPLDTMGLFARTLDDLALAADVLMVFDEGDKAMRLSSRPRIGATLNTEPPVDPRLAFVRTPVWDQASEESKDAFRELIEHVGGSIDMLELPSVFDGVHQALSTVMEADMAKNFAQDYERGKDQLSPLITGMIERGQKVSAVDYNRAVELQSELAHFIDEIFEDYDGLLTPSAPGEAPAGLETTGNPAFCTIWTFCGTPSLNLPVLEGGTGLPIGVQLVGKMRDDARLFRTAKWLLGRLQ